MPVPCTICHLCRESVELCERCVGIMVPEDEQYDGECVECESRGVAGTTCLNCGAFFVSDAGQFFDEFGSWGAGTHGWVPAYVVAAAAVRRLSQQSVTMHRLRWLEFIQDHWATQMQRICRGFAIRRRLSRSM